MRLWPFNIVLSRSKAAAVVAAAGRAVRNIRGRFDSAQTNDQNARHWASADGLSADAAASPSVRAIIRNRSRYESANNAYADGILETLAMDTIGRGPRLQINTRSRLVNRQIEKAFVAWAAAIGLAEKLRVARRTKAVDGEVFGVISTNEALEHPVKIDLRLVEADQVTDPTLQMPTRRDQDGITFDAWGNPLSYKVLKDHPGASYWDADPSAFETISARNVVHYFTRKRPGQNRGLPEIMPSLPLFAYLRRYTLASIAAAEKAAAQSGVIWTDAPPGEEADAATPFETIDLEPDAMTILPGGWKMGQTEAEHPTTTYREFKREIVGEMARPAHMPVNKASGDSSGYNYSSGQLDHGTYFSAIRIGRTLIESQILERLFAAWMEEAILIEGLLPQQFRMAGVGVPPHTWFWDGLQHADPVKETTAATARLANGTSSLADECAKDGRDWEEVMLQRAREAALARKLGLPIPGMPAPAAAPATAPSHTDDNTDDENGDESVDEISDDLEEVPA